MTWLETMDNPPHCEFLAGAIWLYWPADGVPSEQLEKTFGALGEQVDSLVSHLSEEPAWGSEKKEMGSVL
ncbi:MAG: hypothetical protein HN370_06905 [Phycisphaerales bacterium]|nr:hypothetical protein [Phycisphaerales bacterium]